MRVPAGVRACVHACVCERASVRACVCACVRAYVRVCVCVSCLQRQVDHLEDEIMAGLRGQRVQFRHVHSLTHTHGEDRDTLVARGTCSGQRGVVVPGASVSDEDDDLIHPLSTCNGGWLVDCSC